MTEVALVIQRYGKEVTGGAEHHARLLAEHLVRELNWQVHVYTSTSRDYLAWDDTYREGIESLGGVLVHRFSPSRPRRGLRLAVLSRILRLIYPRVTRIRALHAGLKKIERLWFYWQGPYCPKLDKELLESEKHYQLIIFFSYMYSPTALNLSRYPKKAILVPTAHDELPLYFVSTRNVFASATAIFANTLAEKDLICRVTHTNENKVATVGIGFAREFIDVRTPTLKYVLPFNNPYILYCGRIGPGKGVDWLCQMFKRFCAEFGQHDLVLALAGKKDERFAIENHPQIKFIGHIPENSKFEIMSKAKALINPSALESLSLVVLEGCAAEVPILVNLDSPVLAEYANKWPSILGYRGETEFLEKLLEIISTDWSDPSHRNQLSEVKQWAISTYSWGAVLEKYDKIQKRGRIARGIFVKIDISSKGATDVGRVRSINQDSILVDNDNQLYIVADGMGGHAGGEIASKLCIEEVINYLISREISIDPFDEKAHPDIKLLITLSEAINHASAKIYEKALEEPALKGMGTTATIVKIIGRHAYYGHVGDSRLYLIRRGLIYQLTHDHSLVSEQVRAGILTPEEADIHHLRNVITRSVGYQEEEDVDTSCILMEHNDMLILCSDGLHGKLQNREISQIAKTDEIDSVIKLIALANERGGDDNISVIVIKIQVQ